MEHVRRDSPDNTVYVMDGTYPYYEDKLRYDVENKLYIVRQKQQGVENYG